MADRTYGGNRRITTVVRPTSKPRKTSQRKETPAGKAVVFSDTQRAPHRVVTNFPLFGSTVPKKKPPLSQPAVSATAPSRTQRLTRHAQKSTAPERGERSPTCGLDRSPTPVEEVSTQMSRINHSLGRVADHHNKGPPVTRSTSRSTTVSHTDSYTGPPVTRSTSRSTILSHPDSERDTHQAVSVSSSRAGSRSTTVSHTDSERDIHQAVSVSSSPVGTPSCTSEIGTYRPASGGTEDYFPFEYLPADCKLKVFSYLSSHDKGRCAQVCAEWCPLIHTAGIWAHVSFSDFPFWCVTSEEHNCVGNCFVRYRVRVKQFIAYLKELRPILRSLEFKFDIGENADGFLQPLENLIEKANTSELRYAAMNWRETPCRPFWQDSSRYIRCDEMMQKHRFRQRLFVNFIDLFTKQCPKVETLVIPFDWSEKSIDCLLRLKHIRSLVLEKYFVFQNLCQDLLDKLLLGFPALRQLMLEIWTPSGHGLEFFSIVSPSIEYLDVSQSRGFYLNAVHLPRLEKFRVVRHPWNGPLVLSERVGVPCLYDVLAGGAPKLKQLNEHYLQPRWREEKYPVLEEVLKSVCSCRRHKSGWAM